VPTKHEQLLRVKAKRRDKNGPGVCRWVWARQDSNLRSSGYASHYGFRRPFQVCGLDYPFTL